MFFIAMLYPVCVMECLDGKTPDPQCRTCMPKCPDSKLALWGKVKDAQTLLPLSRATIQTGITGQEVTSSVNGDFGMCVDNGTVSFHLDSYLPQQIALQSGHINVFLQKIGKIVPQYMLICVKNNIIRNEISSIIPKLRNKLPDDMKIMLHQSPLLNLPL